MVTQILTCEIIRTFLLCCMFVADVMDIALTMRLMSHLLHMYHEGFHAIVFIDQIASYTAMYLEISFINFSLLIGSVLIGALNFLQISSSKFPLS